MQGQEWSCNALVCSQSRFPNGASTATNERRSRGGCVGSRWLRSRSHGAVVVGLNRQRCRSARNAIKCENGGCLITRLINVNEDALLYMAKHSLVTGMDLHTNGSLGPCDGCAKGKHPQAPFPKQAKNRADTLLGRLHMDIQGPFKGSIAGLQYTLAVIDDCS